MQSPWLFVRRWSVTVLCWAALVAAAVVVGVRQGPLFAYGEWAGIAAVLCAVGALLIRSQPMGKPTIAGRTGYTVVHFGFRAGQGKLLSAALISWMVWSLVGAAAIWIAQGWGAGGEALRAAMGATWCVNTLALMYIWGIMLRNRPRGGNETQADTRMRMPAPLLKLTGALGGLTVVSLVLWFAMATPAARLAALLLAAGPVVVVGGAYGLVLGVMMTAGKNVRWN
jgi:hypothetical protein